MKAGRKTANNPSFFGCCVVEPLSLFRKENLLGREAFFEAQANCQQADCGESHASGRNPTPTIHISESLEPREVVQSISEIRMKLVW